MNELIWMLRFPGCLLVGYGIALMLQEQPLQAIAAATPSTLLDKLVRWT